MDERETFLSALRASFGANDNNDAHKSPQQHQTSFNIAGHVFNIDKVELSIVLPDSKKKLTNRAFVLSYLQLLLATDSEIKKSSTYPPVGQPLRTLDTEKNSKKLTFREVNFWRKVLKIPSTVTVDANSKAVEYIDFLVDIAEQLRANFKKLLSVIQFLPSQALNTAPEHL